MSARRLAVIALLGAAASCTAKPTFYGEDGARIYGCLLIERPGPEVEVIFSDEGRTATVTLDGVAHHLIYRGNRWFKDVYADDSLELSLDPELSITANGEPIVAPCS